MRPASNHHQPTIRGEPKPKPARTERSCRQRADTTHRLGWQEWHPPRERVSEPTTAQTTPPPLPAAHQKRCGHSFSANVWLRCSHHQTGAVRPHLKVFLTRGSTTLRPMMETVPTQPPATHVDDPSPTFISSDIAPSPAPAPAPGSERLLTEEACSSGPCVYKPVGGSPGEPECLSQRELGALALRLPRVRSFTRPWRMILAVSSRGVAGGVSIKGGFCRQGARQVTGQPRDYQF